MVPEESQQREDEDARALRRLIFALTPGVMFAGIAGGIAFPILPSVGLKVGLPLTLIGAILAANRITRILVNPVVGVITDRFGGRRTLLAGLALQVFVVVLFILGVRTTHAGFFFLAGRIVHGFGSSCVFVSAQALALHGAGARHGGRATGSVRAAIQVGVPLGLVLGGTVSAFWGDTITFGAAGGALLIGFIVAFARVPDLRVTVQKSRLIDALRTLVDKRLGAIGGLAFASTFAGSGMVLTMTTILVHSRHVTLYTLPERATSSVLMGWLVLSEAMAMPWLGRVGDRKDAHAHIATIGVVLTLPALVIVGYATKTSVVATGMGILGVAMGCLGPSLLALVGRMVPPERRGLGVGALSVTADVGGALGPLCGSALFGGSIATPYLFAAAINALFVPVGLWLVRASRAKATGTSA